MFEMKQVRRRRGWTHSLVRTGISSFIYFIKAPFANGIELHCAQCTNIFSLCIDVLIHVYINIFHYEKFQFFLYESFSIFKLFSSHFLFNIISSFGIYIEAINRECENNIIIRYSLFLFFL